MRTLTLASFLLAATACATSAHAGIDGLQASYDFLVSDRDHGGVLFKLSPADGGYTLPASFRDHPEYWAAYVCKLPGAACDVVDTYNAATYELTPQAGAAGELQTERVNVHNSANIYDAATWQIAVMLGSIKNRFPVPGNNAYALASNLTRFLEQSGHGARSGAAPGGKRATTAGTAFLYNGRAIADSKAAYAFRAIAPEYLARDPLAGTPHASLIKATGLPLTNPAYAVGKVTWSDWKPLTGENAWAFLIGPLQAAYLQHVVEQKKSAIPFDDAAIQNALNILPTFAAMQSAIGGVYYAPTGTIGNEGTQALNPHEVSVENNFSLYAGLQILRSTLQQVTGQQVAGDRSKIEASLKLIDVMIHGDSGSRAGLLAFFRNAAWQKGAFIQGGLANDPAQASAWVPSSGARAVDVQTWGIAALGTRQIDAWFGPGATFALWQNLKTWGGYGNGKTLHGVGYSDRDGNGIDKDGFYRQGIMSAEWTAGAINAVRNMIAAYSIDPSPAAAQYVAVLKTDEANMLDAIQMLRAEKYAGSAFPGKPGNTASFTAEKTKPYLYASKRYRIPFGWYANPLPSTASTAWMLMLANNYDPFGTGGAPN